MAALQHVVVPAVRLKAELGVEAALLLLARDAQHAYSRMRSRLISGNLPPCSREHARLAEPAQCARRHSRAATAERGQHEGSERLAAE